jgi:tryptophan synthase alpha chain
MAEHITLGEAFASAKAQGRATLITYLTAGYPTLEASPALVRALAEGGADIIELGVPFSDPIADGPAIQAASYAALQGGATPAACLELVRALRAEGLRTPLVFMGYYNPILSYGEVAYARDCAAAGVDGLIVPDLPMEEAAPLRAACQAVGLALIDLVAPTTPEARLARIAAQAEGFLYVVSRLGTTGGGTVVSAELTERLQTARCAARVPVAVGFGVSQPEQVRALAGLAEGVIVGSAVVQRAALGPAALREYVATLRQALG